MNRKNFDCMGWFMSSKKFVCAIRCACGHVDVFHLQAKTPEKIAELMRLYKRRVCSECLKKSASARGFDDKKNN